MQAFGQIVGALALRKRRMQHYDAIQRIVATFPGAGPVTETTGNLQQLLEGTPQNNPARTFNVEQILAEIHHPDLNQTSAELPFQPLQTIPYFARELFAEDRTLTEAETTRVLREANRYLATLTGIERRLLLENLRQRNPQETGQTLLEGVLGVLAGRPGLPLGGPGSGNSPTAEL